MNAEIVVLNCQKCNQCLKGQKSPGLFIEGVLQLSLSLSLSLYLSLSLSFWAVLYYTSQHFICWDFVGMTIQDPKTVGMDPNHHHPKPRPSTPQDSFDSILFQYQNEIV